MISLPIILLTQKSYKKILNSDLEYNKIDETLIPNNIKKTLLQLVNKERIQTEQEDYFLDSSKTNIDYYNTFNTVELAKFLSYSKNNSKIEEIVEAHFNLNNANNVEIFRYLFVKFYFNKKVDDVYILDKFYDQNKKLFSFRKDSQNLIDDFIFSFWILYAYNSNNKILPSKYEIEKGMLDNLKHITFLNYSNSNEHFLDSGGAFLYLLTQLKNGMTILKSLNKDEWLNSWLAYYNVEQENLNKKNIDSISVFYYVIQKITEIPLPKDLQNKYMEFFRNSKSYDDFLLNEYFRIFGADGLDDELKSKFEKRVDTNSSLIKTIKVPSIKNTVYALLLTKPLDASMDLAKVNTFLDNWYLKKDKNDQFFFQYIYFYLLGKKILNIAISQEQIKEIASIIEEKEYYILNILDYYYVIETLSYLGFLTNNNY